jgi:hypothetical protein
VLVGPFVPYPQIASSVRARLFLIVDDHSRLLVHGRFQPVENTRAGQDVLRQGIVRCGLPEVLYADNGAPFNNHALARTCATLGISAGQGHLFGRSPLCAVSNPCQGTKKHALTRANSGGGGNRTRMRRFPFWLVRNVSAAQSMFLVVPLDAFRGP